MNLPPVTQLRMTPLVPARPDPTAGPDPAGEKGMRIDAAIRPPPPVTSAPLPGAAAGYAAARQATAPE